MAKKSNQKIKLLYLMKILLENTDDEHGMTLAEISDALGEYGIDAERKTLYNDIEVLCLFGLDIEKRKGKSVTYHVISREFELPELKLKEREIVSLFANLLDNAREAGVVAGEGSRTSLRLWMEAETLHIQVRNTKSAAIRPNVDRMQTTKPDQVSHGFGVSIIREIVEAYEGTIQMQDLGTEFLTEIRLPEIRGYGMPNQKTCGYGSKRTE